MDTPPKRKAGRPGRRRTAHLHQRCSAEWLAWLNEFAISEGEYTTDVIAKALDIYAGIRRFRPPPER